MPYFHEFPDSSAATSSFQQLVIRGYPTRLFQRANFRGATETAGGRLRVELEKADDKALGMDYACESNPGWTLSAEASKMVV